jgi:hypothetical protein
MCSCPPVRTDIIPVDVFVPASGKSVTTMARFEEVFLRAAGTRPAVVVGIGCLWALCACAQQTQVGLNDHAGGTLSPPVSVTSTVPGKSTVALSVPFPARAFIHCGGWEIGEFAGKYWSVAGTPPPIPALRPDAQGVVAEDGYRRGTLTLIEMDTAVFRVDDATVLTPGVVVTYHPAVLDRTGSPRPVCA